MFVDSGTPALVLAPMDGVTDALMRDQLGSILPLSYAVSEFVRVSNQVPPKHTFEREIPEIVTGGRTASGLPVQVQILGGDPERMAEAANNAIAAGAQGIDINFGCPAPTVNRHDGGATLLKFPDRIETIVRSVRSAVPLNYPVSAKLRLGFDDPTAIHLNAERAARGGASWITIHGRTKTQGYTPPAYWRPIGEVRRSLDIPVIANGEVWNCDDLKRCLDESGCHHVMIGRGVLADPGEIARCAAVLGIRGPSFVSMPLGNSVHRWCIVLNKILEASLQNTECEVRTLARMKQILNYAHKRGTISWFSDVKRCRTLCEWKSALRQLVSQESCMHRSLESDPINSLPLSI